MKDIIVGDIHLDVRNGDKNFYSYQEKFFNQLYTYIENNDDIRYVIFLGDIFTNKDIINIEIMSNALKIMEKITSLGPKIIMINGNHVIYYRNSYILDSVNVVFNDRKNIDMIQFNDFLELDDLLFFNWRNTKEEYVELFDKVKHPKKIKYVFGHFELYGFMLTRYAENKKLSSLKPQDFDDHFPKLKKVISGHYHTPQEIKNVLYPGTPYQLSWSEEGLTLGFTVLEKNKFKFIKNEEQMYHSIKFDTLKGIKNYSAPDTDYKCYFKLIINDSSLEKEILKLKSKLDNIGHKVTIINNFDFINDDDIEDIDEDELELVDSDSKQNNSEMNIEGIIKNYIESYDIDDSMKDEFLELFMSLYHETKNDLIQNFEL